MNTKQKVTKRKILLFLPLIVFPLLGLGYYLFFIRDAEKEKQLVKKGINRDLPDAAFTREQPQDKYGYYQQSDRDSVKIKDYGLQSVAGRLGFKGIQEDPQTIAITQKLSLLDRELNRKEEPLVLGSPKMQQDPLKGDVDRLEGLMKSMQENKTADPEMEQLNGMLQGILDIQHPGRVQQRLEQTKSLKSDSLFRAIPAIIANHQKVVQGATIKLVLQDSVTLAGQLFFKGHSIYGICQLMNQRLLLNIKNIRLGTSIVPVDLTVYSLDGMEGINAPEVVFGDAVSGGTDNALQSMQFLNIDQSIGLQAAGAGINTAKNLFSKKVRRIKVKLEAGQPVLLRNNKSNQQNFN
ncbi:hypothetical protein AQ505_16770 [Pedobacter sp. PACM 27299]|uniref:conjugative transposon protein TraM n=1 Tax=Pedobacter sp. PACM 27299 TaxID=1727164 RepID=UPI0007066AE4|nr:conjugative transposon protein TraM [Pedobacter sp. PACM 27299]ALL06993.1 hypothetical protein AQ505_16770 [Pedobacter sp. PACM 27299]